MTKSDSQLLERAREYDTDALGDIYARYAEPIYRYLYRILGDAAEAEDLTSEVFLKLLETLGTRRAPREKLGGWLYRVAHNSALDYLRKRGARTDLLLEERIAASDESPPAKVEARQTRERLRKCIHRLTADQQQVILLRFGEGLRLAEVAELMDKSLGAVKILQYRAVRRLRKLLT